MDDELKSLLGQLLAKVDDLSATVATLATKEEIAGLREENAKQFGEVNRRFAEVDKQFVEVKHVAGANYLKLSGQISGVANMLADHIADYHVPGDRKRA